VTRGTVFQQEYERALRQQCSVSFETVSPLSNRWLEVRAYPTQQGLTVYFRDVTDRKLAEEQLRQADQRKNEFLAILAHELRNPLAPLRNGLHILKLRPDADPTVSQTVNMMDRQMTHLVRLVDDLLDVSRITRGKLELRQRKALLSEILDHAVESVRALIESRRHELVVEIRAQNLLVDADPDRLAQVFSNLLSNAAKYTEAGGHITLSLDHENDEAVVAVQDNGVGIPPYALEQVFDMFSQVRSGEVRSAEGLGIGLSLVRTLVQMHSGTVCAFSDGPGRGARFTVRLPVAEEPVMSAVAAPTSAAQNRGQRVLVVDDNTDAATSLALLLRMEDYEVCTAADGEEAIEQTRTFGPQIIFMDLAMPRLDGLEAARRIRALPQGEHVRIVALTGWGQEADIQRTRDAGMDHHLTKPVSLDALQSVLRGATLTRPALPSSDS
jgi:signal transduction histidine kinase/ActR/RegA family two-component response regulator